ncbi:MAG: chemotaxis protein CheW [Candidatus Cyclobacteriaceae bacterium M3_2C_046]
MTHDIDTTIDSYLSFKLGKELFAANVGKVLEILELTKITKVPQSPEYMRGVINLRGNVLPVIDTRIKFGLPQVEDTIDTCIIVLDINMENESIKIGVLVDSVQEVLQLDEESIQPPPSIGHKYKSEFIQGMGKVDEDFVMILNIDKVLSTNELSIVQHSTEKVEEKSSAPAKKTAKPRAAKKPKNN